MTGSSVKLSDIVHLLPLLICYLLNYEVLFSVDKALDFVTSSPRTTLVYSLTVAVFYGHALFYVALLVRTITNYQTKAKQNLSAYNPDTFKWHWSLVIFMILIWGLKLLSILSGGAPKVNLIADCLMVLLIYFFAIAQWRKPSLFHVRQLSVELAHAPSQDTARESDGLLDQGMRASVLSLVQNQVKEQALYRDSDLTLSALAEQVGVSVHHLSETLNQLGGKNFNQFINEYRVAEVCKQLDQNSERKLIDVALDAGFSSKSSFNAIFKKITGKTPSLYRQKSTH